MAGSDICTYLSSDETTMQKEDGNIITTFRGETATLEKQTVHPYHNKMTLNFTKKFTVVNY